VTGEEPLCFLFTKGRKLESNIGLFADDCIIYRKIRNKNDIEKLPKYLDTLGGMGGRKWDVNKSR
jgi:hypothetical protein